MQKIRIAINKDIFSANYDDTIIETIISRYPGSIVLGTDEFPIPSD